MNNMLPTLFVAWTALATAAIAPGPNMVAVTSRALGSGHRSALAVAFGIAIGGFGWAFTTSLGLGTLFANFPVLLKVLGIIGGTYLAYLGYKGWRSVLTSSAGDLTPAQSSGVYHDIRYGLIVTATNPKVAMLWASLSTFVGGTNDSLIILLLFASVSSMILFTIYGGYGLLFSAGGVRSLYKRFYKISDGIFGTVFAAIGIGMILRSIQNG